MVMFGSRSTAAEALPERWVADDGSGRIVERYYGNEHNEPTYDDVVESQPQDAIDPSSRLAVAAKLTASVLGAEHPVASRVARFALRRVVVPSIVFAGALPLGVNTGLHAAHIDVFDYPVYTANPFKDVWMTGVTQPFNSYKDAGKVAINIGTVLGKVKKVL